MAGQYEQKLAQIGITLPEVPKPAANYEPYAIAGNLVFLAGQLCRVDGKITHKGKVGREVEPAAAKQAARVCGINLIAALKLACDGDLDRVKRCVSVRGFVASDPSFTEMPTVINGTSDLFVEVFGDAGRHSRTAIGIAVLPADCAVEVDAVFELK
ncbi:MAG: RidA family protein [Proteobacteria bacterium]|nr:RidA family protein [Burkholderiales bacterium]